MKRMTSAALALLFVGALNLSATGTIGATAINPSSIALNTATAVLVTANITDPSLISSSVNLQRLNAAGTTFSLVGSLYDDGTHGDAVAGDHIFSAQFTFNEPAPFPVTLRVSAAFSGSLTRSFSNLLTLTVVGAAPAVITFTSPTNLAFLNSSPVTVNGTVSDPTASVTINGIAAPGAGAFSVAVPLLEGNNILTAVATNSQGTTTTASIQVTLDTTPPRITIDSPADGFSTSDASITVTGIANDTVVGTVNSQHMQVSVNGVTAQVANRSFQALNVPLSLGANIISAVATDQAGNGATARITVNRTAGTQPRITVVSGNNQTGPIAGQLSAPIVAGIVDGSGNPIAGQNVVFTVTQNNGTLAGGRSTLAVTTDSQGQAQTPWTLGTRSGAGNNVVTATAFGFAGSAVFTATGTSGTAAQINVDAGNDQNGAVGQPLPHPFVVAVTDSGHNRLPNVPVTFNVIKGGGTFNGLQTIVTNTDPDGRALAILTLGPQAGIENNVVEANFSGNAGSAAAFSASGLLPGNPAVTRITGTVLDNSNNPIPGVTLHAFLNNVPAQVSGGLPPNVTAQSDSQGQFSISPAPVGFVKLIADGSTAQRTGKWPNLEYELVTVPGQNNTLGMPIYLLPLDTQNQLCVSPTTGGTLTLPKMPGFSLTVLPGAAIFPGGSQIGCITVTSVHPDKIPMPPGFGQQPRFIVTVQPAGTLFNPPAAITIPNLDSLPPRQITEMYSFDHDLGTFVSIGTGTVSDDGSTIRSDPGVGVLKAGWFCGGNPTATGSAGVCPQCRKCNGSSCVPDAAKEDQACTVPPLRPNQGVCKNGDCVPVTITFQSQSGAGLASPLRLGVSANGHDRTQHLQAIVSPSSQVGKVSLSGTSDLIISNITKSGGAINFDVVGVAYSNNPGGDSITAKHTNGVTATQSVSVVVPFQVGTPHDTTGTLVPPFNLAATATTSPAAFGLPAGQTVLWTVYERLLTVTVWDQFKSPIGDLYAGATITENGQPIAKILSSASTYQDPAGVGVVTTPAQIVPVGDPAALAWPTQPILVPTGTVTQNTSSNVEVDGFELNPAVVGRTATLVPPNNLTITWP